MFNFYLKNIKAVSPVVATALILVVAVISVIGFSGWFTTFSSSVFVDVESQGSSTSTPLKVEGVVGNVLYINSDDNTSINSISINGIDCEVNQSVKGISNVDISPCLEDVSGSANIVVVTDNKILDNYQFIDGNSVNTISNVISSVFNISLLNDFNSFSSMLNGPNFLQVDSDYIYAVSGSDDDFYILNHSNNFSTINEISLVNGADFDAVDYFKVVGDLLYVPSTNQNNFQIFNISNPLSMTNVDTYTPGNFNAPTLLEVQGNYAYVLTRSSNRFHVLDVSNPSSVSQTSFLENSTTIGWPTSLHVENNLAVVYNTNTGYLIILDVSNPASVDQIWSLNIGGFTYNAMEIKDDVLYVLTSAYGNRLISYDISNLNNIVEISRINTTLGRPNDIEIINDKIIGIDNDNDQVCAYNILSPGSLSIESCFTDSSLQELKSMVIFDDKLFISGRETDSINILNLYE